MLLNMIVIALGKCSFTWHLKAEQSIQTAICQMYEEYFRAIIMTNKANYSIIMT